MRKLRHREVKTAGKLLIRNMNRAVWFHNWHFSLCTLTAFAESFNMPDAMLAFYVALFNTKHKKILLILSLCTSEGWRKRVSCSSRIIELRVTVSERFEAHKNGHVMTWAFVKYSTKLEGLREWTLLLWEVKMKQTFCSLTLSQNYESAESPVSNPNFCIQPYYCASPWTSKYVYDDINSRKQVMGKLFKYPLMGDG